MIVTIKEPFGGDKTIQIDGQAGQRLGDLLARYADAIEEVWIDGEPCERWQQLDTPPARAEIFLRPKDPLSAVFASITAEMVATALITAAIGVTLSVGMQFLIAALTPKAVGKETGRPEEIFGIAGLTNTVALGTPKMLVYGQRRVFGHIISTKVDVSADGRSTAFGALYYMGEGPIDGISRVEINDTAVEQYGGVTTAVRLGTPDQAIVEGFESISQVFSDGRQIPFTPAHLVYTGRGSSFDSATLILSSPFLYNINQGNGKRTSATHTIHVNYKRASEGSWTVAPGSPFSWQDNSATLTFRSIHLSLPGKDRWEFQVGLGATSNENQTPPSLYNVQESESTTLNYPNSALLAVFGVASAQITSFEGMRTSALVRGRRVKVWTGTTHIEQWTDNRVWVVRDLLTNPRVGLGTHISESLWNDTVALEAANFYAGIIDGETRDVCDLIVNDRRPGWDWIKDVLAEGRAILLPSQGQFKYIVNRNKLPNLLYSSPGNVIEGSLRPSIGTGKIPPNTIRGEYPNRARNDLLDIVQVQASGTESEPLREETMSFRTITRESQVFRELTFYLKRSREVKRRWQWKSPHTALVSEPLDVDQLAYDTTNTRRGMSGYCPTQSSAAHTSLVELDRLVTLETGKTYSLILRHIGEGQANLMERKQISMNAGTYGRVQLATPLSAAPREGDLWAIGEQNTQIKSVLIEDIQMSDEGEFTLTASEFLPSIYDSPALPPPSNIPPIQHTGELPIPLLAASVTYEPTMEPDGTIFPMLRFQVTPGQPLRGGTAQGASSTSIRLAQGEPDLDSYFAGARIKIVEGVGAGSERRITAYTGSTRTALIDAAWANIPNASSRYEVHFDNYGDFAGFDIETDDLSGLFYFLASAVGHVIMLPARGGGETNNYRFTPFSVGGVRNLNARWVKQVTQTGDPFPPNPPSGLTAVGTFGAIVLNWSNPADADLDVIEIYSALVNNRANAVFIAYTRGTGYFHGNLPPGQRRWYWIRARDRSGNTSEFHPVNPLDGVDATVTPIDFSDIDTEPPAVPVGLVVTTGVTINPDGTTVPWIMARWTPNSEQDIGHYQVQFRVLPSTVPFIISTTIAEARWDGVPGDRDVGVSVAAIDRFGNASALTAEIIVRTARDTIPPAPPTNLLVTGSYKSNSLLWTPPGDPDYELTEVWAATANNRSAASKIGEGTFSFIHGGLPSQTTYYYWIRARDFSGNLSAFHPENAQQGVPGTTLLIPGDELEDRTIHPDKLIGDMRSLATNSDFESGNRGWTGDTGWSIIEVPGLARSGTWLARHVGTAFGARQLINHAFIPVHPGDQFYVSQFFMAGASANGVAHAGLLWYDRLRNLISANGTPTINAAQAPQTYVERAAIIAAPNGAVYARAYIQLNSHTIGEWYFDDHLTITAVGAQLIAANTISAVHLRTDTAVITGSAQIANAIINSAHIQSLIADKIAAGTLNAFVSIGVGNNLFLHAPERQILVFDSQSPQRLRVQIGRLDTSLQGYGMRIFNPQGVMIFDLSGVPTEGIQDGAVTAQKIRVGSIDASHLRTDTIVVTGSAQIANLIVGTQKIANQAISQVFQSNVGSGTFGAGAEVHLATLTMPFAESNWIDCVVEYVMQISAGDTIFVRIRKGSANGPVLKEHVIQNLPASFHTGDIRKIDTAPAMGQVYAVTVTSLQTGVTVYSIQMSAVQIKK